MTTSNLLDLSVSFKIYILHRYYRPKRSFGQGNIFTPVCHSFCSQGGEGFSQPGGFSLPPPRHGEPPRSRHPPPPGWRTPPGMENHPPPGWRTTHTHTPPGRRTTPPGWRPPHPEADSGIRSTIGRYASYWNAFLFKIF